MSTARADLNGTTSNICNDESIKEAPVSIDSATATTDDSTAAEPTTDTVTSNEANADTDTDIGDGERPEARHRINLSRVVVFGVLPALALLVAVTGAYFKWQDSSAREADVARNESALAARDSTIALLSYQPDKVDQQLEGARSLLTGQFRDSYSNLVHDVVIPGAKQKHISAVASVPAVASVSATPGHAVALVFVDQSVIVGNDAPSSTASTVRVTLDKVDGRWLISGFDPI